MYKSIRSTFAVADNGLDHWNIVLVYCMLKILYFLNCHNFLFEIVKSE